MRLLVRGTILAFVFLVGNRDVKADTIYEVNGQVGMDYAQFGTSGLAGDTFTLTFGVPAPGLPVAMNSSATLDNVMLTITKPGTGVIYSTDPMNQDTGIVTNDGSGVDDLAIGFTYAFGSNLFLAFNSPFTGIGPAIPGNFSTDNNGGLIISGSTIGNDSGVAAIDSADAFLPPAGNPEPASLALVAAAGGFAALVHRRRRPSN